MTELGAWILFPLLVLVTSTGVGLLVERLAGIGLASALVPPVGLAGMIALLGISYGLGGRGTVAVVVVALATAGGFWLGRAGLGARFRPGYAAAAGAAAYGLYIAPVVLSGHATFLGYNFLNDTSIHLLLVDYINELGQNTDPSSLPASSFASAAQGYIGKSYPLGSHEPLAALREVMGMDPARLYQPYLAVSVGLAASALFALVRRAGAPALAAAVASVVALASQLLFSFNLQGGIKELTFVTSMATAAAVGAELRLSDRPTRMAAVLALPAIAAYAIYGVAALAWLGPLTLLLLGSAFVGRPSPAFRARLVPAVLTAGAVFVVLGLPSIIGSVEFYDKGESTLTGKAEFGPLVGPIRTAQVAGIWLRGDYRFEPTHKGRTYALIAVALALAAIGAWLVLRRRAAGPALFLLPSLAAWLAVSGSGSPYVDAKLLAVLSPAVVLFAAIGVGALWRGRIRLLGAVAALVLVGAIGVSDALAYRVVTLAPMDRLDELSQIGHRFKGQGPMLLNEFEEYAKTFARGARPVDPYEGLTPVGAVLRKPRLPVYAHAYTLDELTFGFVSRFPLIAVRRSPAESRPPAGYTRVFMGRFYEVWRRTGPVPATAHEPFGRPRVDPVSASSIPSCSLLRRLGAGSALIAAVRPEAVEFNLPADPNLPPGWTPSQNGPGLIDARFGGSVFATARTGAGRQRVWLKGKFFRDDEVLIDGRRVGNAQHNNGPNQWVDVGSVDLGAGLHKVEFRRPKGSLAPGDHQADTLGPAALEPERPEHLVHVAKGRASSLCGRPLDWVEKVPG